MIKFYCLNFKRLRIIFGGYFIAMFSNENLPKICSKFYCKNCNYSTGKKSSYNEHLLSAKHEKSMFSNQNLLKICSDHICQNCNKMYKDNSGLWRHKKNCKSFDNEEKNIINTDLHDKDQLIMMLIKQNSELIKETTEFKNTMMEQQNEMIKMIEKWNK